MVIPGKGTKKVTKKGRKGGVARTWYCLLEEKNSGGGGPGRKAKREAYPSKGCKKRGIGGGGFGGKKETKTKGKSQGGKNS